MHHIDEGEGPPVLFVHGTPTWSFEYRHLIAGLRDRHRCLAVDHLGFGLSERPPGFSYRVADHARNLAEFIEKKDLRELTLVVHDFGGPIALPLSLGEGSRVSRVVLLNTWMWPFEDPKMLRGARFVGGALGRLLYRYLNFSLRVLLPSVWADRRRLTRALHGQYLAPFKDRAAREQVLWQLARALLQESDHYLSLWDRRATLQRLPTLIVWGLRDGAFPPSTLERWKQALPSAEVVALEDAGHWPHEEQPDAVLSALSGFLERTAPSHAKTGAQD